MVLEAHILGSAIKQEKEIKGIKIMLFIYGIIVYAENYTEFTKKLLELICELIKVAGQKVFCRYKN